MHLIAALGMFVVAPVVALAALVLGFLVLGPVGLFLALILVCAATLLAPLVPPVRVPRPRVKPPTLALALTAGAMLGCWLLAAR